MQISYHSFLTKIQKLQNFKIKKKKFLYRPVCPVPTSIARYWPVFLPVRNVGINRTESPAGTVYSDRTGRYGTVSTTLLSIQL